MSLISQSLITFIVMLLLTSTNSTIASSLKGSVIQKKLILKVSKKKVWAALTRSNELDKWWHKGVILEPSIGGGFYEPWGVRQLATGTVLMLKPLQFIEFTWREKSWNILEKTKCSFTIKELAGTTTLYIEHSGWEIFKDKKKREELIKGFNKGWDALLPRLEKYMTSKK